MKASADPPGGAHRLEYLDGIRGLTALYVLLYHAWQFVVTRPELGRLPTVFTVLKFGNSAVAIFIVLSGYCLMMPSARRGRLLLSGGLRHFLLRRAYRILPAYYATLVGSALLALTPILAVQRGTQWDIALPVTGWLPAVTHLAMVHNLTRWEWSFDPPMWSVGLEWQIYFLFALVLLPLARRIGQPATVALSLLLGCAPSLLWGGRPLHLWYVGLFGFGMMAASLNFGSLGTAQALGMPVSWYSGRPRALALGVLSAAIALVLLATKRTGIAADVVLGCATACLLFECTRSLQRGVPGAVTRILGGNAPRRLGRSSYSLYLIHYPLVALMYVELYRRMSPTTVFLVMVAIGVPLILALSYGWYLAFERPFLPSLGVPEPRGAGGGPRSETPQAAA